MRSSRRRVYTILGGALVGFALTGAPRAFDRAVSVDGTMVQGPTSAPVTIVEFSDYQ